MFPPVLVLINPAAGSRLAHVFVNAHVLPLLPSSAVVRSTDYQGQAGILVLDYLAELGTEEIVVMVASGDGTVHEIVDALYIAGRSEHVTFVLIPCGTANALYHSLFPPNSADSDNSDDPEVKLRCLREYLGGATPRPLCVMTTTIGAPGVQLPRIRIHSVVVTSTAAHAAILHDSEALRASMPGVERFAKAAQDKISVWYAASVRLLPPAHLYSQDAAKFIPVDDAEMFLKGPFAYFLSATNVDRLEPNFRIVPPLSDEPFAMERVRIVMVRPMRDPLVEEDSRPSRTRFANRMGQMYSAAYTGGQHPFLTYGSNGELGDCLKGSLGRNVVEVFRCSGWEWAPDTVDPSTLVDGVSDPNDPAVRRVCVDGTILDMEPGEIARCVLEPESGTGLRFSVYGIDKTGSR